MKSVNYHNPLDLSPDTARCYRQVMKTLEDEELAFMIGGAYALACYTDVCRHTKDLDLFVRQADVQRVLEVLDDAGFDTELTSELWLAKACCGEDSVDLIFNSGNGLSPVDDRWFDRAPRDEVMDIPVYLTPPEEMIWMKAFIMERDRFDGADVAHVLQARADTLHWERLLELFGDHWRVLLGHLILFGFIYPGERERIPRGVMTELLGRLQEEMAAPAEDERICQGTLLSRMQYLEDITQWGYEDGRVRPHGNLEPHEAAELSNLDVHPAEGG